MNMIRGGGLTWNATKGDTVSKDALPLQEKEKHISSFCGSYWSCFMSLTAIIAMYTALETHTAMNCMYLNVSWNAVMHIVNNMGR